MIVAIPSHKRIGLIQERTLQYLSKCSIPNESIYIFVSNKNEYESYSILIKDGYNIVYTKDLNDLKEKHNAIIDYFNIGDRVIVMEDDIKRLVKKSGNKVIPCFDFNELAQSGWEMCEKNNTKLWGINPTNNGFYMSDTIDSKLKVIAGYLFGIEITKDKFLYSNIDQKHDYERTLLYYIKYGSVIRINYVGQESVSFTTQGGLQAQLDNETRCKRELECNEYLLKRFPHLVKKHHRLNKHFTEPTELLLTHSIDKKGKLDLYSLQKFIDKKIT